MSSGDAAGDTDWRLPPLQGVDMVFLRAAFRVSTHTVYSLHKSSTRDFIAKTAKRCVQGGCQHVTCITALPITGCSSKPPSFGSAVILSPCRQLRAHAAPHLHTSIPSRSWPKTLRGCWPSCVTTCPLRVTDTCNTLYTRALRGWGFKVPRC